MALIYFVQRDRTRAKLPSVSPTPVVSTKVTVPMSTPKPSPRPTTDLNLDAGDVDPPRKAKADKSLDLSDIAERATPLATLDDGKKYIDYVLVDASDVLGRDDMRRYRFRLEHAARVRGSFTAQGNIKVDIVSDYDPARGPTGHYRYYTSNGKISADTIDMELLPGTYDVQVSSDTTVSFSIHLSAHYGQ
jgi:hypothetical protein